MSFAVCRNTEKYGAERHVLRDLFSMDAIHFCLFFLTIDKHLNDILFRQLIIEEIKQKFNL